MSSKERAELKARANSLDTILQVGWQGVGENLIAQVDGALEARELIKLRVLPSCPLTPRETADSVASACNAETVQVIGTKIILYRKKTEKPAVKPKIKPGYRKKALRDLQERAARREKPVFPTRRSGGKPGAVKIGRGKTHVKRVFRYNSSK